MNWDIETFDTLDSTNRYLLDAAKEGAVPGRVAVARHQSLGRGRRGRVWDSKPGASLLFSVLFRPPNNERLSTYPQAVGLAVRSALTSVADTEADLKWPNDVLVSGRKIAGVLAEAITEGERVTAVVVGCGVNVNWGSDLPAALRETATSADLEAKRWIDPQQILSSTLDALDRLLEDGARVRIEYRSACSTIGQRVRVQTDGDDRIGVVTDLTDEGALVLATDAGDVEVITVGEAVHLRAVTL